MNSPITNEQSQPFEVPSQKYRELVHAIDEREEAITRHNAALAMRRNDPVEDRLSQQSRALDLALEAHHRGDIKEATRILRRAI